MKFVKAIFFSFLVFNQIFGFSQENIFLLFGGDKNDFGVSLVEKEGANGFLVLGSTRSYGNGSSDYYLISLNSDLKAINETTIGGVHHDLPKSILSIGGNNYALFGSMFDFKPGLLNYAFTIVDGYGIDSKNELYWRSKVDVAGSMIKTADGSFAMIGMAASSDAFGQYKFLKVDIDGEIMEEREYGTVGVRDYGFDIIENEMGYLMLSSSYCEIGMSATFGGFANPSDVHVSQVDFDGEILWEYDYEGDDFDYAFSFLQSDNIIYVAMNTRSEDAQSFDIKVLKINSEGELLDSFNFGGDGFEYVYKIIEDSNGDLLLCGVTSSEVEKPSFYAIKITKNGELLWERKISADASIYAYDIIEMRKGNYLFTGKYAYDVDRADVFILEMDKDGNAVEQNKPIGADEIFIYPNPSYGNLVINTGEIKVNRILLYNLSGQMVFQQDNYSPNSFISLELSEISSGMYILTLISDDNKQYQEKLTIY